MSKSIVILIAMVGFCVAADKKAAVKKSGRAINPAQALEKVNDATDTSDLKPGTAGVRVIRAQILMDRARFSPGEIDGKFGVILGSP